MISWLFTYHYFAWLVMTGIVSSDCNVPFGTFDFARGAYWRFCGGRTS